MVLRMVAIRTSCDEIVWWCSDATESKQALAIACGSRLPCAKAMFDAERCGRCHDGPKESNSSTCGVLLAHCNAAEQRWHRSNDNVDDRMCAHLNCHAVTV